jgi:hypothetical protein
MHLMKATTKVAAVLLVLAGCTGEPVLSGGLGERQHGGLMFFRTFNSGDPTPELYRLPAPGAAPVRVTPVLRGGTSSSTSADGEWLAWLDEDVVWLRFLRNANERRVTPPGAVDGAPRLWHGGGRLILMRARQDQAGGAFPRITTVDVATLEESALDPDDGVGQTPALSPDGQLIVWRSSTRAMGLELLDAQGEWIRTLVPGAFTLRGTDSPVFSPNGLSVAFVARYFNTPNHSIVVINLWGRTRNVAHAASGASARMVAQWGADRRVPPAARCGQLAGQDCGVGYRHWDRRFAGQSGCQRLLPELGAVNGVD